MKCKLINSEIKSNYGTELLKERGVSNVQDFLNPSECLIQEPSDLDNVDEGINLIKKVYNNGGRFLVVVDSDCDGYTSAAIIYLYLKDKYKNINIDYVLHSGKQHGLQDHITKLLNENIIYDLVILPDSSSNDAEYHEQLKDINLPCLVIDHHIIESELSSNATIINNQTSKKYKNKALTGAGVVWQFCRRFDKLDNTNYADNYIDLAALGIVGDMGSMLEIENQAIVQNGLNKIRNFGFKTFCEKQDYSMSGEINPTTVAFYIVPLINAMIRVGTMEGKVKLFEAFIRGSDKIESQKRGAKGELDYLAAESARECTNARSRQNKIVDSAISSIEIRIHKYNLLENKILFIKLEEEDDFPSEINGLVAMKLSKKFKRPTIVARLNDYGEIKGSARGLDNCEVNDFKEFLAESGCFEWALGHANAFGACILNDKLSLFHKYANNVLKDTDFDENIYEVNFIRNSSDKDISAIVYDISRFENYFGAQNPTPLIYIKNIRINKNDVQVIGKDGSTVKFEKNGITYIKFHAKELIEDLEEYDEMSIEVVGKMNLNEFRGNKTPQIFIENYEIKEDNLLDF